MYKLLVGTIPALLAICLVGCGPSGDSGDAGGGAIDAQVRRDGASDLDAGARDGSASDGSVSDGSVSDGSVSDGSASDAGRDAGPNILRPNECRADADCDGFLFCLRPGAFAGCGICMSPEGTCSSDADCTSAGQVCESAPTDCFCAGESTCRPGCTADSCAEGEECGATGHCQPGSCSDSSGCPTGFDCVTSQCTRRGCSSDAVCGGAWCVEGSCYTEPGMCRSPAA